MTESTVLGMPLDVEEDDVLVTAQPLSAMVVVKALDEDGHMVYLTAATPGLLAVECIGMARYAILKLEQGLIAQMDED